MQGLPLQAHWHLLATVRKHQDLITGQVSLDQPSKKGEFSFFGMGYFIWNWGKKAQAVVFSQLMSLKTWSGKFGWDSLPNCTTCFWLSRSRWCSDHGEGYRQRCYLDLRKDQSRLNPLNLEVMDRKSVSGAESEARSDSEQGNVSDTDPEEGGKCATEDSNRTWRVPSLQELEEVLHSAPRSCRHGDEVWPNLYLGDMWVFCAWCKFTCIFELSRLRITSALFCCEAPKKVVWITKLLSFFNRLGGEKITSELNFFRVNLSFNEISCQVYVSWQARALAAGRYSRPERSAWKTVLQGQRWFLWDHSEILRSPSQRPANVWPFTFLLPCCWVHSPGPDIRRYFIEATHVIRGGSTY